MDDATAQETAPGKLSRDAIVAAAITIADQDGLQALSMRRIADALSVGTMSLYRHIADKEALYEAMTAAISAESQYPDVAGHDWTWRERVTIAADIDWALYRQHPWLLFVYSSPRYGWTGPSLRCLDWLADAFSDLEVSPATATGMALAVWDLIAGAALPAASEQVLRVGADRPDRASAESILEAVTGYDDPEGRRLIVLDRLRGGPENFIDRRALLAANLTMLCDGFAERAEAERLAR